ncbi:PREDICTED: uncharacterized protein LOC109218112 [Nicotiana attenuata]|uniref:uncharacterized protein LOC109218112 n=1 Tax=Nicotiana attenuata TaxID=49451 RepID=UPI000905724A|nr:PREDICTED: uncharacterized protein LOC109218112 [Nicotiana attenuata]
MNPYCIFLKSLTDISELTNFYIALKSDSGLDQRTYNLPTSSEVAAIWIEDESSSNISLPHIRIYTHSCKSQLVNYYYSCYDPLQYPLLFPYGQNGWHCGIKKIIRTNNTVSTGIYYEHEQLPSVENMCSIDMLLDMEAEVLQKKKQKRNTVSCREYYCYKLQMRDDEENGVLHAGRAFQQYSVDQFIKLETQRLDFYSLNQDLFRVDASAGLLDVLRHGERDASNIGKQSFLPASFVGGPRDMRRRYMDAIALVQHFGKPDIFLTMTCNPSWPEIEEHLLVTDEKHDLPHAHFLIILNNEYKLLTPEAYDKIVCAELPDRDTNN